VFLFSQDAVTMYGLGTTQYHPVSCLATFRNGAAFDLKLIFVGRQEWLVQINIQGITAPGIFAGIREI
jgi:hypothetical protein